MSFHIIKGYQQEEGLRKSFGGKIRKAVFQFVPQDTTGLTRFQVDEEDTTFFIRRSITEDIKKIESFPKLAQA